MASERMHYELNILTNDGWVVTLLSDRAIDLGNTVLSSIIVQPKQIHDERVANDPDETVRRSEYRLRRG
jgi:sporulation protein YlmC with PRC-barrel domain